MPQDETRRVNSLEELLRDIRELQDRERKFAYLVQVPRERARKLLKMNHEEWVRGSRGFLSDANISTLLGTTFIEGVGALESLTFGETRIKIADRVEDDCGHLTILSGKSMD